MYGSALALQKHCQQAPLAVPQVVVAMLEPLTEGGEVSAAAAGVVQGAVSAGRQHFPEQLRKLPPLPPSIPALQSSNAILAEQRGTVTAEEHIDASLESLQHHSLAVRANALQVLPYPPDAMPCLACHKSSSREGPAAPGCCMKAAHSRSAVCI